MKVGARAEHPLEWGALVAGVAPTPLLDTMVAMLLSRSIRVATKLGIFEALAGGALTADEVAARCACHPTATEKLLSALAGAKYVRFKDGRFTLAPVARRWLLKDSPTSLHDAIVMQDLDTRFMEHAEEYVRSGQPVDIHHMMSDEEWGVYQRGMRAGANFAAVEVARRIPVPKGAQEMLDIGGAHGYYSVAVCRRHSGLRATILDLPEAVAQAAPILAREGMGDRVRHRADNALTADLGMETFDVVLIANLMHHFGEEANRELVRRVARALRPGGVLAIGEVIRPARPGADGQTGALTDLYFAVTSESGTWSFAELAGWQRMAGLHPRRPIRLLTAPGGGLQVAVKPI
ncbi:MAG: methyltransferase [Ktedonobacterales bacterium]